MCEVTARGNDNKEITTDFAVILYMDYTGSASQGGALVSCLYLTFSLPSWSCLRRADSRLSSIFLCGQCGSKFDQKTSIMPSSLIFPADG